MAACHKMTLPTLKICPFKTVRGRLVCRCGNRSDDPEVGFESGVIPAFVCTPDGEDERMIFSHGAVAVSVCCKCFALWPVGSDAETQQTIEYMTTESSCSPVLH